MPPPLGYLLTWTSYGTWLPGDRRGWVDRRAAGPGFPYQEPDPKREDRARNAMSEPPVLLDKPARQVVDAAIRRTCAYRGWIVHALNVRSNHAHIVVSPGDLSPGATMKVLKAYASRALNEALATRGRKHWWTSSGSTKYLNSESSLFAAIRYVQEQDKAWMKGP